MPDRLAASHQNAIVMHARDTYKATLEAIIQALGREKFIFPETAPLPAGPEMLMSEEPAERSMAMREMTNGYRPTA